MQHSAHKCSVRSLHSSATDTVAIVGGGLTRMYINALYQNSALSSSLATCWPTCSRRELSMFGVFSISTVWVIPFLSDPVCKICSSKLIQKYFWQLTRPIWSARPGSYLSLSCSFHLISLFLFLLLPLFLPLSCTHTQSFFLYPFPLSLTPKRLLFPAVSHIHRN